MKRNALAVLAAVALSSSLTGCALFNSKLDPSPELEFSYTAANGPATGLVRAFVLNGSTVLQFVDIAQAQPKVYAGDQAMALPYQVIGQYAILSGIHSSLRVVANGATATVAATRAPAPKVESTPASDARLPQPAAPATAPAALASPPAAPAQTAVTASDLLQHELQELAQLRKEVAELKRRVADVGTAAPAGAIVPAGVAIRPAALIVPAGEAVRSWSMAGNRTLKDNLADLAQQAGYTLTWKASNPYMVTYTKKYQGAFQDVVGEIALEAPALDFRLYAWKRRLDVVDAGN